jgi:excinuclease ABC subunit A
MGVLYILDEPSIGLHQRDNARLLQTLYRLRDLGNTLVVVEHDEETMTAADHIIDIGPGAGINGGRVVCTGTAEEIMACPESVTGQYLSGKKRIPVPGTRREGNGRELVVYRARKQSQEPDGALPAGEADLRDRSVGQREVVAGAGDPVQDSGLREEPGQGQTRKI